ncbi:hypothetical protein ACWGQ4_37075 [Streptomyces sp. NPDC055721]|uniref:hypothetical protein n=1 Tax=Streptomyces sp. NPDC127132 TaxID=3345374 RepID=UPI00364232DB
MSAAAGSVPRMAEWEKAPLPDRRTWYDTDRRAAVESFLELTASGAHVDAMCDGRADPSFSVVDDVWDGQSEDSMFITVHRKECAVSSLFHALGPTRERP